MTRDDYILRVEAVLSEHTTQAAHRLSEALARVPPTAQQAEVQVFVDQDGEGFLDVRLSLVGPDLFVLNRAIAGHAELFSTRMAECGFVPALPLMEPGHESFSVHDALTDCAAAWVAAVWEQADHAGFRLPIAVVSPERYGITTPFHLSRDSAAA